MSVIAEFSISASDFVLGKALQAAPHLTVEIDQMIPVDGDTIPYVWVIGEGRDQFDTVLEREQELEDFAIVDEIDDRILYRIAWSSSPDTFVRAMADHDVVLQEASGDADSWTFQVRFPDSHTLSAFHTACHNADIDLTVDRLYNPIEPTVTDTRDLTEAQHNLIERAYDAGYFDVPRKVTLIDLAEELGISDQSVNERMRRGLQSLIETTIKSEQSRQED